MDFLSKSFSIKFDLVSLSAVFIILAAAIVSFLVFKRIQDKKNKPKTGFLGKPLLVQVGLILMGASVLLGAYFLSNRNVEVTTEARKDIKINIDYKILSKDGEKYLAAFKAVPSVDSVEWGEDGDSFDIFWSVKPDDKTEIKGQKVLSYIEVGRNANKESEFDAKLIGGTYTVKVVVSYNSESYEQQKIVNIP